MLELLGGLAAGLVLSVPVGPMGVLAMLKKHDGDPQHAFGIAVGVSMADALLALLATLPADWLTALLSSTNDRILSAGVAAILAAMAWQVWRKADEPVNLKATRANSHAAGFGTGLSATLGHPANVATFVAGFAWLETWGISVKGVLSHTLLVVGVFLGSMLMWAAMLEASGWLGRRVQTENIMPRLRRAVALAIAFGSLVALYRALF